MFALCSPVASAGSAFRETESYIRLENRSGVMLKKHSFRLAFNFYPSHATVFSKPLSRFSAT